MFYLSVILCVRLSCQFLAQSKRYQDNLSYLWVQTAVIVSQPSLGPLTELNPFSERLLMCAQDAPFWYGNIVTNNIQ